MSEQAFDSGGNIFYIDDAGQPIDGVIDTETGLFIPGVDSQEDIEGSPRDPFTGKPFPQYKPQKILSSIGFSLVKIFQHLWHAFFIINPKFWLPIMGQWLDISGKYWKKRVLSGAKVLRPHIANNEALTPDLKEQLDKMLDSNEIGDVIAAIILYIPWYTGYSYSTIGIMKQDAMRALNKSFTPTLLDAPMYINYLFRNPKAKKEVDEYLKWLGLSDVQQNIMQQAIKNVLQIPELAQLRWRGEISETEFKEQVKTFGYTDDETEKLYKLIWFIPPVNDLVRFAVREAFSDDIIQKYELGANFPYEFGEQAKKVGLTEEWAKRYWYAHWELPSIEMGFEMLHRGVINHEDINLLLRTKDVMPYWREKITQISYRPYSRVDVRRMHKMGVLTDKDVLQAYLDIGYSPDRAEKMKEFTILYNQGGGKDLSKAEYIGAYIDNLISKNDCIDELINMGYSEEEANLLIKRAEFSKFKKAKELSISNIKQLFLNDIYTDTKVIEKLAVLGVQSNETADLLELWKIAKESKLETLPEEKLHALLIKGIIDPLTWSEEMSKINYSLKHQKWLYKLYTGQDFKAKV